MLLSLPRRLDATSSHSLAVLTAARLSPPDLAATCIPGVAAGSTRPWPSTTTSLNAHSTRPPPPPPPRVRASIAGARCAGLGAEVVGGRRCVPLPPRDPGGPSHLPRLRIGCTVPRITLVKSGKAEAYPTVEIDLADAQVATVVLGELGIYISIH